MKTRAAVAYEAGAEERRRLGVRVALRDREAEALVGDGELGVAAVDVVAGEARVVAQVLAAGAAVAAAPARPAALVLRLARENPSWATGGWTAVLATDNLPDEHDVDTAGCLVLRPGRGGRSTPEARSAGRRLSGLLDQLHEPRRVVRVSARVARIVELDRC